jgi:predicted transcriptional regulator
VAQSVNSQDRFNSPSGKCPICSGWERGNPQCKGYLGEKPGVVFCTSSDYAGILVRGDTGTFRHWTGPQGCKCGVSHLPSNNSNYYYSKPKAEPMINHDGSSRPKTVEETYPYGGGCFVDRVLTGYTKEDGKPEKTFQQYQVIDGKKVYQGFKKLYRLDEVKASGKGFYFLVEGERKVNKLWEMGFPATCNVGGSGSWADNYADELPQGATAYIWPDNDDAGLKWTDKIISSLSARKIKWHVTNALTVGLPNKGDVMDWVKLPGNDAARLQAELDRVSKPDIFEVLDYDALISLPPPDYLIKPFLLKGYIGCVFGATQTAKSFWALMMCLVLADQGFNVLYLAGENATGYGLRLKAWYEHYNKTPNKHFKLIRRPLNFLDNPTMDKLISTIKETFPDGAPVLIVVDTLSKSYLGGDENDSEDMRYFVTNCERLRDTFGSTVLVNHHSPKSGGTPRGSSVIEGDFDILIEATKDGSVSGEKRVTFTCVKQKDAPGFDPVTYKVVETGDLPTLEKSCVLEVVEDEKAQYKSGPINRVNPGQTKILEVIGMEIFAGGVGPSTIMEQLGIVFRTDQKSKSAFNRDLNKLLTNGYIVQDRKGKNTYYTLTAKGRDIVFEDEDF